MECRSGNVDGSWLVALGLLNLAAVGAANCRTPASQGAQTGHHRQRATQESSSGNEASPRADAPTPVRPEIVEACQAVTMPPPDLPEDARVPCEDTGNARTWAEHLAVYRVVADHSPQTIDLFDGAPEGFELRRIGPTATLAHRDLEALRDFVDRHTGEDVRVAYRFMPARVESGDTVELSAEKSFWHTVILEAKPVMRLKGGVQSADAILDDTLGKPFLELQLTPAAGETFHEATKASVERKLAFVHGDLVVSAPKIMEPIPGGTVFLPPPWGPSREMDAEEHSVVVDRGGD